MANVISERRKKKLVYNRYFFWRDGQSSDGKITFWRCSNRYKSFRKARVHTVDGLVTKELNKHSHLQEERHVQIAKVLTVVKERAATANDMSTPANIMSDATVGLPGAVRAHIVEKNVKRTIQRTRLRTAAAPANPQNCEDLEIPDSYKHILLDDARGHRRSQGRGGPRGPGPPPIKIPLTTKSYDNIAWQCLVAVFFQ